MKIKKQYIIFLSKVFLLLAALTRIIIFLQNRSLFLDEANLARNIIEKSPLAFFKTLDYEQYAPPLFLLVQKFNVFWLGASEYGVRFFPLIAGLLSLWLFYRLARQFLDAGWGLLFIIFIFSFGDYFLHFGTEGKQYASDIMFTLLLLNLALSEKEGFDWKQFFKWSILGMFVVWFSMPVVFILSGSGIYFMVRLIPERKQADLLRLGSCIVLWIISFGIYYYSILRSDVESDYLQNFHNDYFLPGFPTGISDLKQYADIFLSILKTSVGHTLFALIIGMTGLVFGILNLILKDKKKGILLFIPVLSTLSAAALHQYSLIPRLTLFFIPLVLIIIGVGIQSVFDLKKTWVKVLLLFFLLITASIHDGVKYIWQRYEIEEIRQILDFIKNEKSDHDLLYINHSARPAVYFYTSLHKNKGNYNFTHLIEGDWKLNPDINSFLVDGKRAHRVWVVYSHLISDAARIEKGREMKVLLENFDLKKEVNFKGAAAVLIER